MINTKQGNSVELLKGLESNSIDLIVSFELYTSIEILIALFS
jgi:hypothetical protein